MSQRICIVGNAGTVGMTLASRLSREPHVEVLGVGSQTPRAERERCFSKAEVIVLCVGEQAAGSVLAELPASARVLDTSPAHRLNPHWVYGLPELCAGQPQTIAQAQRVANPGCYATGGVLALRPLTRHLAGYPVSVFGVGGLTSGGNRLVKAHQADPLGFRLYGLDLAHRHTEEIARFAQLSAAPVFTPGVAAYDQGTLVQVPLSLVHLGMSAQALWQAYLQAYQGSAVELVPGHGLSEGRPDRVLDAGALAGTDRVELRVDVAKDGQRALVSVRFDNLGKGAAGAALANLRLMLGLG